MVRRCKGSEDVACTSVSSRNNHFAFLLTPASIQFLSITSEYPPDPCHVVCDHGKNKRRKHTTFRFGISYISVGWLSNGRYGYGISEVGREMHACIALSCCCYLLLLSQKGWSNRISMGTSGWFLNFYRWADNTSQGTDSPWKSPRMRLSSILFRHTADRSPNLRKWRLQRSKNYRTMGQSTISVSSNAGATTK